MRFELIPFLAALTEPDVMFWAWVFAMCLALVLAVIVLGSGPRQYRAPMTEAEAQAAIRKINRWAAHDQLRRRWLK